MIRITKSSGIGDWGLGTGDWGLGTRGKISEHKIGFFRLNVKYLYLL
ncbi:MAG: hypothetical protein KME21_18210 [Desmonostoc vinosum HA7617-LM4]|nr:hypothetical protein [Desmonostoc vinosum HA7617-LM4]